MSMRPTFLLKCQGGSAAVEMALVTPLLLTLLFGSFELGNYFLDSHVVAKAARDGARYASRQSFTNYPCAGVSNNNAPIGTVVGYTQNLVRTGQITGGTARLPSWSDPNTVVVRYDCVSATSVTPSYSGIYNGLNYLPIVKVEISYGDPKLQYQSLFGKAGFNAINLSLVARSQAAVMGI